MSGIILAGVSSNSGKTTITMGLLRALYNQGKNPVSAKVGPDYIDPSFHTKSCKKDCVNLDMWAMNDATINTQISYLKNKGDITIIEGVMGLFDGAADGTASTAHIARKTGYPIILVLDAFGQSSSIAGIVKGFDELEPDIKISGVILNRTGSQKHIEILVKALQKYVPHIPYIGAMPRENAVVLDNRHLGLVQADEISNIDTFLETSANWVQEHLNIKALLDIAKKPNDFTNIKHTPIPPLGKHIAVAKDEAFNFIYPHIIHGWEKAGAKISYFSPLKDEAPNNNADSVYLAGGYPELYAEILSNNQIFQSSMRAFANEEKTIFGECGGFMVLGENITDKAGIKHTMLGLLPISTSFKDPKLHLTYRKITTLTDSPFGKAGTVLKGHEFHYAHVTENNSNQPLFKVEDALGEKKETVGAKKGSVYGSYMHLIDTV